ncbi:MAG: hypothetical protein AABX01_06075 [Candidatus Micrarchaeota archaeon]
MPFHKIVELVEKHLTKEYAKHYSGEKIVNTENMHAIFTVEGLTPKKLDALEAQIKGKFPKKIGGTHIRLSTVPVPGIRKPGATYLPQTHSDGIIIRTYSRNKLMIRYVPKK